MDSQDIADLHAPHVRIVNQAAEIERLRLIVSERDDFLRRIGQWSAFIAWMNSQAGACQMRAT